MPVVAEKLSPGIRLLTVRDVKQILTLISEDDARLLLSVLGVPILKHFRQVPQQSPDDAIHVFTEERVLAMALELALFAHLCPGGPGLDLTAYDLELGLFAPKSEDAMRARGYGRGALHSPEKAAYHLKCGALRSLDYWKMFRSEPYMLQLMIALAALMYGSQDEKELKKRLSALGTLIAAENRKLRVRGAGTRRRPKPPTAKEIADNAT